MEEQNEYKDAGSALAEQEQAATEQEQTAAPAEPERPEVSLGNEREETLEEERQERLASEPREMLAAEPQDAVADEGQQTLAEERPEPTPVADAGQQPLAAEQPAASDAPAEQVAEPQDFGAALAEHERTAASPAAPEAPKTGSRVSGRIVSIGEETALVDLGTKSEGFISLAELKDAEGNVTVQVGQTIDAVVTGVDEGGAVRLKVKPGRGGGNAAQQRAAEEIKLAQEQGLPVEGRVTAVNKGGVEVQVSGLRAFCPASQLDLRYVEDPSQFVGQTLAFRVTRFEEGPRGRRPNIVLSRRSILEEEAKQKAAETRERLKVGAVVKGRVTSLTSYGAFVDLGGIEGMLHVSRDRPHPGGAAPRTCLTVGQEVEVQVTKVETGKDKARAHLAVAAGRWSRTPGATADAASPRAPSPGTVARLETVRRLRRAGAGHRRPGPHQRARRRPAGVSTRARRSSPARRSR